MKVNSITLYVNGTEYRFSVGTMFGQLPPSETLSETLRNRLGLTGSKQACGEGVCGCCTVIVDGDAITSCITLTVDCDGKHVITIEGLQNPVTGELDPIQQAFLDKYAFQCGYCTPGIIMATKALLDKTPHPDDGEIKEALSGNFCRCISQYHVFEAIGEVVGKVGK
ncbi:(2Fe-2S)-binding protein [Clostridium sp. KNHs216]|uniref:(2Fe-2S)-binding protein n=1 Tax=Clostridium sp. KNHs216 TaxID=1550235 RepID=UPI001151FA68|nr:(2Fe-2S)-binding protein [Clostridium sp. KNHs216]TQI68600.1 carbon-monoxide dehydrogenase small subunit [Clostridium sp. KNHs216]